MDNIFKTSPRRPLHSFHFAPYPHLRFEWYGGYQVLCYKLIDGEWRFIAYENLRIQTCTDPVEEPEYIDAQDAAKAYVSRDSGWKVKPNFSDKLKERGLRAQETSRIRWAAKLERDKLDQQFGRRRKFKNRPGVPLVDTPAAQMADLLVEKATLLETMFGWTKIQAQTRLRIMTGDLDPIRYKDQINQALKDLIAAASRPNDTTVEDKHDELVQTYTGAAEYDDDDPSNPDGILTLFDGW